MDGKFKVFVIVAIVVLALSIGASVFFVMKLVNNSTQNVSQADQEQTVKLQEVDLGDAIMTNIAMEDNNVQHYAKIQISIGIDATDEKACTALVEEITAKSSSIRSEVIDTIGEQTFTMLSNTTTGKEKLSDEIIARLNKLLDTDMVKDVYYKEYFVQ